MIAGAEWLTRSVLKALPELRVVARAGVGYDRVDVAAATECGVVVTITPTANHEAVAEHALALLLAAAKSITWQDRQVREGHWPRQPTVPLRGRTLGILGLGRIGRSLAVRALGLGMRVVATEKWPDQEFLRAHAIELVDFDRLLAESDFLSVHCPLDAQTKGLFRREVFERMKPGSVFINTARGELVVEEDLLAALRSGRLRAAGLDVLASEPPPPDHPLLQLDNVVLTPHLAGVDERSLEDMGIECAQNIIALYQGRWPEPAVVNGSLKGRWSWL